MALRSGRAIRFNESNVRPMGRGASGVRGVTLADEETDEVVGLICVDPNGTSDILVVSEKGYGKRSELEEYRVTNRGGKGVKTLNITDKPALSNLVPTDPTAELTTTQALVSLALVVWMFGTILSAIILFIKRHNLRVLSPSPDRRSTRSAMRDALGSPGMLAALILLSMIIVLDLVLPVLMA